MNTTPMGNTIKFEDIDYNIQISIENNKIKIALQPTDSEIPFIYNHESNLEELGKLNAIFSVFDSLEEIKNFLIEFTSTNDNIKITQETTSDSDEEGIIIQIKYFIGKISKTLNISLQKIITDDKKMIKYLSKLLKQYKQKSYLQYDSKLITHKSQIELIKSGIQNLDKSKQIQLQLLFRASRDGDTIKSFHEKVDGIYPTISIIQVKSNNYIFGGFTDHPWDSKSGCVKTKNTFMFSFDKNKIYVGKNGGFIHCTSDYGPWFCGGAGVYLDNYFKTNNSYQWELNTNKNSFDGFTEDFELVGGIKNFTVNEVEVFKVEYA